MPVIDRACEMLVLVTVIVYFVVLLLFSRMAGGKGGNAAFFCGDRRSPWPLVAFGMVGASISGLTLVGVPGWVTSTDMTYLQMCLGFVAGYLVVAFVLLPVYYKLRLTSIYAYLLHRFGMVSYRTGASFFILSKLMGAAVKFYLACQILRMAVSDFADIPYPVVVAGTLILIWLYTRRGGIRALVWTDALQTVCLLLALGLITWRVTDLLDLSLSSAWTAVWSDPHSRIFEFADAGSKQYFWKQFLSGALVVVAMTGLDQDMMQKNLTCRDLRSAQKDMCSYGVLFVPVNFLFLALGVLLVQLCAQRGISLPASGDDLLPSLAFGGSLGAASLVCFTVGVMASAFSSVDSALTALTTSVCVDILGRERDEKTRKVVHLSVFAVFGLITLLFHQIGSGGVMDLIYTLVSYTYGPLLGLFAFGMATRRRPREAFVPLVAVASPLVCLAVDRMAETLTGYQFGYEILLINASLTFAGLLLISHEIH